MYARHKLVWLTPEGWSTAQRAAPEAHRAALELWERGDWPLVVRRRDTGIGPEAACLGLPLPPAPDDGGKVRIALCIPHAEIHRASEPLPLKNALTAAPPAWQAALAALADEATGLTLRVYGSLAMQALTGLPYVTATSDIDLLLYPHTERQLAAGLALLKKYAALLPLDGEIVFPRGDAVAWKEWLAAANGDVRVLVKDIDTVRLTPARLLLATLKDQP